MELYSQLHGILPEVFSDYHQFVMSGRTARNALAGCAIAGLALILIGFLPAAVVVAMPRRVRGAA